MKMYLSDKDDEVKNLEKEVAQHKKENSKLQNMPKVSAKQASQGTGSVMAWVMRTVCCAGTIAA